jgi:plasmid replication initiation protein
MAVLQLTLPGEIVKKSNALLRAKWQPISVWEPRIVALVASKIRADDDDFQTYKIPIAELTGHDDKNLSGIQYSEIKKSILHLAKLTIAIQGNKPQNFRAYPIFSMCGYEDGYLIARFDPDLKPHFLHLKKLYGQYSKIDFWRLASSYSQQVFELLISWNDKPEVEIEIAELHDILHTPPSFRANFKEFRRRVLEQAHKDITKKTSLLYDWKPIKKGRSVVAIRFIFSRKAIFADVQEKEKAKQQKAHIANANIFNAVTDCFERKKHNCAVNDNKVRVCKLCIELQGRGILITK